MWPKLTCECATRLESKRKWNSFILHLHCGYEMCYIKSIIFFITSVCFYHWSYRLSRSAVFTNLVEESNYTLSAWQVQNIWIEHEEIMRKDCCFQSLSLRRFGVSKSLTDDPKGRWKVLWLILILLRRRNTWTLAYFFCFQEYVCQPSNDAIKMLQNWWKLISCIWTYL